MNQYHITSRDGYKLSIHTFDVDNPQAVVQVIHGMEEHQERYEDFARFLNGQGFSVVTSDMRGHGKEAEALGYFCEKKGYRELIADQIFIRAFIGKQYPQVPVYLFAHSMGTIIARVLLQKQSKRYEKAALSGYPNYQPGAIPGIAVSALLRTFRGAKYKSAFLEKNSVGSFNKAVENPVTESDWICSNPEAVAAYREDAYCGTGFTCSAFNDLFHLVTLMHKPQNYRHVNEGLSFLLLRGGDDPCTGGDKGAEDSLQVLKKAGFFDFREIVYPGMRHEILNETGKQKVYEDIARFYQYS